LRILMGLWRSADDPAKVSRRLGLSEGSRAFTTLAELRQELQTAPEAIPVPEPAAAF
jgi:hypothetical protein